MNCDGCNKALKEGDQWHMCFDGPALCESCAPTYQDALNNPETFTDHNTGEQMSPEAALAWVSRHLAAGGSLSDPIVS